jgi:hypothetical protein
MALENAWTSLAINAEPSQYMFESSLLAMALLDTWYRSIETPQTGRPT